MNESEAVVRRGSSIDPAFADLVEELTARFQAGDAVDADAVLRDHPTHADQLRDLLPALRLLADLSQSGPRGLAAPPANGAPPDAPAALGDFRIVREVGRGGMGVVYEAEQLSLARRVALKVLPFAGALDARQLQRFRNEAQAAAQLHHTHIVPVFFVGAERGVHFYAMQLIDGHTLAAVVHDLRRRKGLVPADAAAAPAGAAAATTPYAGAAPAPPTVPDAQAALTTAYAPDTRAFFRAVARLGAQAAEALDHAHQHGIVHRDVKPSNLMVDAAGDVWVTDFGLAQFQTDAKLTMTGDLVGTLRYMSPEQALAQRVVVDHRTDVYSLGATLYELLALEPAYPGADRQELLRQLAFDEPRRLRRLNRAVPAELETIVAKALEKNPADRYGTARELADDLKRYLNDEPPLARRPTLWQRGQKWSRRHVAAVRATVAALVVVVGVVAGGLGWVLHDRAARELETDRAAASALQEADHWQRERKLPAALNAARQAAAALATGAPTPALQERVQRRLADLTLVAKLEGIRQERAVDWKGLSLDDAKADRDYAQAFRDFGVDVANLSPDAAAKLLADRTVGEELAAALDDWAVVVRSLKTRDGRWKRLLATAHALDADPFRKELRKAREDGNHEALDALLTRARAENLSARTVLALAGVLNESGRHADGAAVLRQAPLHYFGDYWFNFHLAYTLARLPEPELDDAIRYYTAALALRPDSAPACTNLGVVFRLKGRLDDAVAMLQEARRLKPDLVAAPYHLGDVLQMKGQLQAAVAAYREAIRLKPDISEGHTNLSMALSDLGRPDEALVAAREAVRLKPEAAGYHLNLSVAYSQLGKPKDALAAAREAVRLEPAFAEAHVNAGNALRDLGQLDKALAAHLTAVCLKPELVQAHAGLGRTFGELGQLNDAIAAFRQAVALKPDNAELHYSLGLALLLKGKDRLDEAAAATRTAIRLRPNHVQAHTNLGIILDRKGLPEEAAAAYREALRHQPDFTKAHYNLGFNLYTRGQFDEARKAYEAAVRKQPDYALAHIGLGKSLLALKRPADAVAAYRDAARHAAADPKAHYELGLAFNAIKQLPEALAAYDEAIRLKPNYARAHNNRGNVLADLGKKAEALGAFREAVRHKPDLFQAHYNAGNLLRREGKVDEAIDAYRQAVRHKPDFLEAHFALGTLFRKQGKVDDAIGAFQTTVRIKPYPGILTDLAHLFEAKGQFAEAIAAYQQAVKLEPTHYPAHSDLAWLLGTAADERFREPKQALASAKRAVELAPTVHHPWKALGVAHYRNGDWQAAIDALGQSMKLRTRGGDSSHFFFLAMTHWRAGQKDQARTWYARGTQWMEQLPAAVPELDRFRAEAAALLGIRDANPQSGKPPAP